MYETSSEAQRPQRRHLPLLDLERRLQLPFGQSSSPALRIQLRFEPSDLRQRLAQLQLDCWTAILQHLPHLVRGSLALRYNRLRSVLGRRAVRHTRGSGPVGSAVEAALALVDNRIRLLRGLLAMHTGGTCHGQNKRELCS